MLVKVCKIKPRYDAVEANVRKRYVSVELLSESRFSVLIDKLALIYHAQSSQLSLTDFGGKHSFKHSWTRQSPFPYE